MHTLKLIFCTTVGLFQATSVLSESKSDNMELISGKWSHDTTGEVVTISQNFLGWELFHSKFGQFSLSTSSELRGGANMKMSGRGPTHGSVIDCYIYISWNSPSAMTWNLREGPSEACLVGKFSKVPTSQEIKAQAALEEAERKAREARAAAHKAAAEASDRRAKLEADKAAALATEAKNISDAEKTKADRELKERTANFQKERTDRKFQNQNGPTELRGVEVVYIDKPQDLGAIKEILSENNILYSTRASVNNVETNFLNCGPDVNISATKKLATLLIKAGIGLRAIGDSPYPQYRNRLTLEGISDLSKYPIVTQQEVDNMTSCNVHHQVGKTPISIKNGCGRGNMKVFILYKKYTGDLDKNYDRGSKPKDIDNLEGTYEYEVKPFEERRISDINGSEVISKSWFFWYYAELKDASLRWGGTNGRNSLKYYADKLKKWVVLERSRGPMEELACPSVLDQE